MSCDDDYDDGWDPIIDVVEENKLIEIEINAITQSDLSLIEMTAKQALKQKLCKLNIILKNLDVYCHNNVLLVNDRYNICKDLQEIVNAFGMQISSVDCGLRGKSYIIQDNLVSLIKTIDPTHSIAEFANKKNTEELISVIEKKAMPYLINNSLAEIFKTIQETGRYTVTGHQHVKTVYEDGTMIEQTKGEVVSDSAQIAASLRRYMQDTSSALDKTNNNLRDGTAKLLYSRARQMGYAVSEERKGNQVQLVLVREG